MSPVYRIGREDERADVVKTLRRRASSALGLATKGRMTVCEGKRLARWLRAAADDIEAELHVERELD